MPLSLFLSLTYGGKCVIDSLHNGIAIRQKFPKKKQFTKRKRKTKKVSKNSQKIAGFVDNFFEKKSDPDSQKHKKSPENSELFLIALLCVV